MAVPAARVARLAAHASPTAAAAVSATTATTVAATVAAGTIAAGALRAVARNMAKFAALVALLAATAAATTAVAPVAAESTATTRATLWALTRYVPVLAAAVARLLLLWLGAFTAHVSLVTAVVAGRGSALRAVARLVRGITAYSTESVANLVCPLLGNCSSYAHSCSTHGHRRHRHRQ